MSLAASTLISWTICLLEAHRQVWLQGPWLKYSPRKRRLDHYLTILVDFTFPVASFLLRLLKNLSWSFFYFFLINEKADASRKGSGLISFPLSVSSPQPVSAPHSPDSGFLSATSQLRLPLNSLVFRVP